MSLEDDVQREQKIQDEIESQTRYLRHEVAELTAEGKELRKLLGFYEGARKAAIAPPASTSLCCARSSCRCSRP